MTSIRPSILAAVAVTTLATLVAGCASTSPDRASQATHDAPAAPPTPAEARAIAKEAWLYAYAPLQG